MTDHQLRTQLRQARRDPEAGARAWVASLRAGRVSPGRARLAAALGSLEAARAVDGWPLAEDPRSWVQDLRLAGDEVLLEVALSATYYAATAWEGPARLDERGFVRQCMCARCWPTEAWQEPTWPTDPDQAWEAARFVDWLEVVEAWCGGDAGADLRLRAAGRERAREPALLEGLRLRPAVADQAARACAATLDAALRVLDGRDPDDEVRAALEASVGAVAAGWLYPEAEAWRLVREAAGAGARRALGL